MSEDLRLRKMAGLASQKKKLLDLGCSALPNKYLRNKEVTGVDLIEARMPDNYTGFEKCDVLSLSKTFKDSKIDAIVAGELLEHLENPLIFLRQCYDTLENEGILVISTPNPNSFIERLLTLSLSRKYFYTGDHVMLFPQRWLIRIMEIAGFDDVKLYSGGMIFPVISLIPFPRPWCYQTIAIGIKRKKR